MNTPDHATPVDENETIALARHRINKRRVSDLLCSAFEGGSNYWYLIEEFHAPPPENLRAHAGFRDGQVFRHLDYPLCEGGYLMISDRQISWNVEMRTARLDLAAVVRGLEVMREKFPRHFGNFLSENDDGETGDVFLQCALFGDVVYG